MIPFVDSLVDCLVDSVANSLVDSFVDSFVDSIVDALINSLANIFVIFFVNSCPPFFFSLLSRKSWLYGCTYLVKSRARLKSNNAQDHNCKDHPPIAVSTNFVS